MRAPSRWPSPGQARLLGVRTGMGRVVAPDPAWLVLAACLALSCCGGVARANYDTCGRAIGWDVERGADTWQLSACRTESVDLGRLARVHVEPADATCGHQRERFCNLENPYMCSQECDATMPELAHPPELMFDVERRGRPTYWQSAPWRHYPEPFHVFLTLSWNKTVELTEDIIIAFPFGWPKVLVLEKSLDYGQTWQPLQYYADNCLEEFEMEPRSSHQLTQSTSMRIFCTEDYAHPFMLGEIKMLRFELKDRFALFAGPHHDNLASLYGRLDTNSGLREFFMLTDLRLRLLHPATGGTLVDNENLIKYYYAISDISIHGRCWCNLHASSCSMSGGHLTCSCQHYTDGPDCNRCARGYHGSTWRSGSYLPYPVGTANPCVAEDPGSAAKVVSSSFPKPKQVATPLLPKLDAFLEQAHDVSTVCHCHGHSSRCSIIEPMNTVTCVSCKHNTWGLHCEFCRQGFFHNLSLPLHHQNVCVACNCNPFGSSSNRCNQMGQCECKAGSVGLRCDWCDPGYFWNRGCQPNVCDDNLLRCQNGGRCRGQRACVCPTPYSGVLCQELNCQDGECSHAVLHPAAASMHTFRFLLSYLFIITCHFLA
uniref:netrin-G1-like n=1 Tax=Myxine glutinosa TaxID=7769 RepID=UPI00358E62DF